jgi:hypothetical protein
MILFTPAKSHKVGVIAAVKDYQDSHKRRKSGRKQGQKQTFGASAGSLW